MLNRLFGKKIDEPNHERTGIYKVLNRELIEIKETPGIGSINDIIIDLGFNTSQIYTVITFDSKTIDTIGVKILTKAPVFVFMKDKNAKIDYNSVILELEKVDWGFEYSSDSVENIFEEGIENKSLSLDYLSGLIKLKKEGENIYHALNFGLYLYFENDLLSNFSSSDWMNVSAKWLFEVNKSMFEGIKSEALLFHQNEFEAMEEVNLQCDALRNIPQAIQNEFIHFHKKANGNINFYNLYAAHYGQFINQIEEFKLVNVGRLIIHNEFTLEVDGFIYQFDSNGVLIETTSA